MAILDTNFLIALKAKDPAAVDLLRSLRDGPLLVPSVVAAEYLTAFGHDPGPAYEELEASFSLAHTSKGWVELAARLRWSLRGKQRQVRRPDLWIAAWALLNKTFVVTRNERDFRALGTSTRTW